MQTQLLYKLGNQKIHAIHFVEISLHLGGLEPNPQYLLGLPVWLHFVLICVFLEQSISQDPGGMTKVLDHPLVLESSRN